MAWRNGRWEPDIPAPPPPRNVPGAPPAPPGGTTLPQNNNRTAGVPAPPPPPPTPRLPTPPGGANTGTAANVSGANAAYNAGQRGSDPNAVFGAGGAGGYRQWYNQQQGGNRPEDMERFSDETLAGWDQYAVKEGPNAGKYLSMRGAQGYFDKPTECPPGQVPSGPNETDPCISASGAGGGGGAGGQGGSGGGANQGFEDEMTAYWKNLVKNQDQTRFTPEVMAALEADQFARARAQEKNQLEDAKADMAQRGVTGSPNQNATLRGIRGGTGAQIMSTRAQVMKAKVDADYQDKQAAIKNAQDWVNSMRDYMLRTDMNAIQREQIAAQIRLAQMNIKAQSESLEQQYQNNLSTYLLTNGN